MENKAVVLLSGGLDSATVLYFAKAKGYQCHCLIFDYGQRHRREIESAKNIAQAAGCAYQILKINLPWKGSALLNRKMPIPELANSRTRERANRIPSTYVPARNIIFLSFALSFAETIKAQAVFIGAHSQDYSGYPDCRPKFFTAFSRMAGAGTFGRFSILAPLLRKSKSRIILLGKKLKVPFNLTWSCYRGAKQPCGKCDSCYYRAKGFKRAGIVDPLIKC